MALVGGGSRHLKRLAAPRSWKIKVKRRFGVWVTNVLPGPHPKEHAVPLRVLIRDILGLADNAREADHIIRSGNVLVDGVLRKDPRFPVGLFDVIDVPSMEKTFRIVLDDKGRLLPKEVPSDERSYKLVRVDRKAVVAKGKVQLGTHDGRCIIVEDAGDISPGDVIKISVPDQKIVDVYRLQEGNLVYVLSGRHSGTVGRINAVRKGDVIREKSVDLFVEDVTIQTAARNVFVVGRESPSVTL